MEIKFPAFMKDTLIAVTVCALLGGLFGAFIIALRTARGTG